MEEGMVPEESAAVCAALRQNFLFQELTPEQIDPLVEEVWLEQIPAGSVIVREGEPADALYVVVSGGVNVTKADGQFLAFLGPGGFFGEMALFMEGARRSADCTSIHETTCVIVRKEVLDEFCTTHPEAGLIVYRSIIRTLAERLQATSADLAFLMRERIHTQEGVDEIVAQRKKRKTEKL